VKHFLYLTNTRLVSLVSQGRRIVARREFAVSGAGAAAFEAYLANLRDTPTHLFTDLAEEDFRLDTIPHVGKGDREAIVNRKLGQMFRNTPFRHAQAQGREAEGRKDDRVVYTAVTNAEVLRPWVDVLERHEVPLAGIRSTAALFADPHVAARGALERLGHALLDEPTPYLGARLPFLIDDVDLSTSAAEPLGASTDVVLRELCDVSDAELAALRADGVIA